ncbi:hypothetical protein EJ04DRAFT_448511 [Polyplosphaeria fusca]|uniref:Uncharacterized protein n=1 Tax=Polyplosphaeria fusca TaxID=682080 RepID=A0A9P4QK82_9PLEO|nr:hypothetical protein EJ04DRAFT_448511 [Polyplosphaeria fusca]
MSVLAKAVQNGSPTSLHNSPAQQIVKDHITPSLESLIRKHVRGQPAGDGDADDLVDKLMNGGRSIALPTTPGSDTRAATKSSRSAIRMSTASSAKLVSACRTQGISVTSAVNAAIIRVTAQSAQAPEADSYVIWAPCDLRRPLIAAGVKECLQPVGTYLSGLPLRIEGVVKYMENGESIPGKSFSTLASELATFYSQDVESYKLPSARSGKTVSLLQLAEPYVEKITKAFSTFPLRGCPYPKTPVISSLGKLDEFIRNEYPKEGNDALPASKLHITDFWVSCEVATPVIIFNPWTWGGEITLSAAFNESWYSTEFVGSILGKAIGELVEGLKIGPVSYRTVNSTCFSSSRFHRTYVFLANSIFQIATTPQHN